jgi:hypothetical protein
MSRDSILWLIAVAAAFTLAVLVFNPLRMPLNWDESVYSSQISQHTPAMVWSAERARGMPLLVAPVTLLTGSVLVLRVYLALLAGTGLFLALVAWRGLRPDWVLALAGLIFAGMWTAQAMASEVYPNYWIAVAALAVVGLFLRAVTADRARSGVLALLALAIAIAALMRPTDAVYLSAPLAIAAVAVPRWRSLRVLAALAAGLVVGLGEWLVEADRYFGGPFARLSAANRIVGGSDFNPVNNLRILNGGRVSSLPNFPGITGWSEPGLLVWWAAFLAVVLLGIYVVRRSRGWLFALMPAICAAGLYLLYSLPVRDNARYLVVAWALLAIPAADGAAWLLTRARGRVRLPAIALVVVFLAVELGGQHQVLTDQSAAAQVTADQGFAAGRALRQLGVRAPCVVTTPPAAQFVPVTEPAAFYAGCAYQHGLRIPANFRGQQIVVLVAGSAPVTFRYAQPWIAHLVRDGGFRVYVQP